MGGFLLPFDLSPVTAFQGVELGGIAVGAFVFVIIVLIFLFASLKIVSVIAYAWS